VTARRSLGSDQLPEAGARQDPPLLSAGAEGIMAGVSWPSDGGTYLLLLAVQSNQELEVGRLGPCKLEAGSYVYVGSAQGPGGLAARLRRHLRADKGIHWHIDYLTVRFPVIGIVAQVGSPSHECRWVRHLLAIPDATVAIPGFGSSDCQERCPAHLIRLPSGWLLADLSSARPLGGTFVLD